MNSEEHAVAAVAGLLLGDEKEFGNFPDEPGCLKELCEFVAGMKRHRFVLCLMAAGITRRFMSSSDREKRQLSAETMSNFTRAALAGLVDAAFGKKTVPTTDILHADLAECFRLMKKVKDTGLKAGDMPSGLARAIVMVAGTIRFEDERLRAFMDYL